MDRAIRILWLIKGLGAGGAERLLVSAARVGDHRRFSYEVAYVVSRKNALVSELEGSGVPTTCLSSGGIPWPLALRRHLLANRYDVVHLHSPLVAGVARIVIQTLPRSRRPVVVSTEHNTWDSYSTPTRILNASLYGTDRRRWAVSQRVHASVWRPFRDKTEVLVHGIVMTDATPHAGRDDLRSELRVREHEVVAVTVANFRREKAYPDLLAAARIALQAEPRLRLLIVGQGFLESEVRRLHQELELGDRCLILGYRDDVMAVLAASDFFVLSSRFEGLPVALMEAMATGLPVVATGVGGIPEVVDSGTEGLLTAPGDPEALAAAMLTMARDDEGRARMSESAQRRGAQFDVAGAVRTIERAYLELTAS
jgi:glycosyltransferase involved in cell wall biosynthesis